MRTPFCDLVGVDFPVAAFSHCRDVVAAVTNAGGLGVLGASSHTPEQLEHELAWIDAQVGSRPYGVDLVVPDHLAAPVPGVEDLLAGVPPEHQDFVTDLVAELDEASAGRWRECVSAPLVTPEMGEELLEVAMRHPVRLVANALGVPSASMIDRARTAGVPVAALVGAREHAVKQVRAGVDLVVAQGTEAGGHCGEVSTMVLVPEVVAALEGSGVPVLAAGGIVTGSQVAAAVAMGAAGAWTGSVWLTTPEAETAPHTVQKLIRAGSRDTVRSRSRTGKPSRQLRSTWTEAWDAPTSPGALPMPLQGLISRAVLPMVDQLAGAGHPGAQEMATYWVGQGVGLMDRMRPTREVVRGMIEDYVAATDRLTETLT
jgi:NAD(P)H-dependent flavin oxidoreductase YrpB (nitropropane dioxygenase family)